MKQKRSMSSEKPMKERKKERKKERTQKREPKTGEERKKEPKNMLTLKSNNGMIVYVWELQAIITKTGLQSDNN